MFKLSVYLGTKNTETPISDFSVSKLLLQLKRWNDGWKFFFQWRISEQKTKKGKRQVEGIFRPAPVSCQEHRLRKVAGEEEF